MTNEEAIDVLEQRKTCMECVANCTCEECDEAFDLAIKALEQTDTLDKIKEEILDICCDQYCENPLTAGAVREMVLEIIDEYKAESEDEK